MSELKGLDRGMNTYSVKIRDSDSQVVRTSKLQALTNSLNEIKVEENEILKEKLTNAGVDIENTAQLIERVTITVTPKSKTYLLDGESLITFNNPLLTTEYDPVRHTEIVRVSGSYQEFQ